MEEATVIKVNVKKLSLDRTKCDIFEVEWLKSIYRHGKGIPQPLVNTKNEVIGCLNSAAALIDLNVSETYVTRLLK